MTTLAVETIDTVLAVTAPAPTTLVAALDPPLVLEVAPQGATLAVAVAQTGVLTAPAEQGPMGPPGGNLTYTFVFPIAVTLWPIAHGLGRFPSVTLVDTTGDLVAADVTYLDRNTISIAFGFATAGTAYLN